MHQVAWKTREVGHVEGLALLEAVRGTLLPEGDMLIAGEVGSDELCEHPPRQLQA